MTRSRPDSRSNTVIWSRAISGTSAAEPGALNAADRSADRTVDTPVRRQLSANQQVVDIRVRLQLIDRMNDIGQAQAVAIREGAGGKDVAAHYDAGIESGLEPGNLQQVAAPNQRDLAAGRGGSTCSTTRRCCASMRVSIMLRRIGIGSRGRPRAPIRPRHWSCPCVRRSRAGELRHRR